MQLDTPCPSTRPKQKALVTPTATHAPLRPQRLARLIKALRRAIFGDPRIRQLPIGHPDALVDRPGERRIIFGHYVLIITNPKPRNTTRSAPED